MKSEHDCDNCDGYCDCDCNDCSYDDPEAEAEFDEIMENEIRWLH